VNTRITGWRRQCANRLGYHAVWINEAGTLAVCRSSRNTSQFPFWQLREPRENKSWWPLIADSPTLKGLIHTAVTDLLTGVAKIPF
jgi:hypothetical protein